MTEKSFCQRIRSVRARTRFTAYGHFVVHFVTILAFWFHYISYWSEDALNSSAGTVIAFDEMFATFLICYSSYILKEATFKYNLASIRIWLEINGIYFLISIGLKDLVYVLRNPKIENKLIIISTFRASAWNALDLFCAMIETKCFFGKMTVRMATRYAAYVYIVFHIFNSWKLGYVYYENWQDVNGLPDEMSTFHQMTCSILIVYSSYYLKNATYNSNIQSINFWIIINSIYLTIGLVACDCCSILRIFKTLDMLCSLIRISSECYAIYIISQFYGDEILVLNCSGNQNHVIRINYPSYNRYQSTSESSHSVNLEEMRRHEAINPSKFNQMIDNLSKMGSHTYL